MMNNIYNFLFMLCFVFCFGQKTVHIKYLHVRSLIATLDEDLYSDGVNAISIQSGNILFSDKGEPYTKTVKEFHYITQNISDSQFSKNMFFTSYIENNSYFIHDEVPAIKWTIDEKATKRILGFHCFKATATFRGSNFIAYFTKEIPYSIGPFKFSGLPGAILDIREEGMSYNIWKADKIDLDYQKPVDFNPDFPNFEKVKMKKYVELKDADRIRFSNSIPTPVGSTSQMVKARPWIEKVFEWE